MEQNPWAPKTQTHKMKKAHIFVFFALKGEGS